MFSNEKSPNITEPASRLALFAPLAEATATRRNSELSFCVARQVPVADELSGEPERDLSGRASSSRVARRWQGSAAAAWPGAPEAINPSLDDPSSQSDLLHAAPASAGYVRWWMLLWPWRRADSAPCSTARALR